MSEFLMFISFVCVWVAIFNIVDRFKNMLNDKPMFSVKEDIDEDREY
jgi:hypothetical protein